MVRGPLATLFHPGTTTSNTIQSGESTKKISTRSCRIVDLWDTQHTPIPTHTSMKHAGGCTSTPGNHTAGATAHQLPMEFPTSTATACALLGIPVPKGVTQTR